MGVIKVAGIDPSLRNTGVAICEIDLDTNEVSKIAELKLIRTEPSKNKTQRKSSADFEAASIISASLNLILRQHDIKVVFGEIPSGTQSARASFALGITLGIMATIEPKPIEVTPTQTKVCSIGIRTATKTEMIEWAVDKYPDAPWLRRGERILNSNEHLADAIGVVHAGLVSPEWAVLKRLLP